jgi:hypothetical protein
MVIRNAKQRIIRFPVGSWDDEVGPDRMIKEVVGDCQTFLEDDALQPSPSPRNARGQSKGFRAMFSSQVAVLKDSERSPRVPRRSLRTRFFQIVRLWIRVNVHGR